MARNIETNLSAVEALTTELSPTQMAELSKRALLVSLNVSKWDPNITDKNASAKLSEENGVTEEGLCRVRKSLISKNEYTKKISALLSALHTYYYSVTLQYTKQGTRILPVALHGQFVARVNADCQKLALLVQEFVDAFPSLKEQSKKKMGSLYREEDFPEPETLKKRYSVQPQFEPLPNSGQFLDLGFSSEQEVKLREQLENSMRETLATATSNVWRELYSKLQNLVDRVGNPDSRLHESVIEGVIDMAAVLPQLNVLDDPNMNELASALTGSLEGLSMAKLKVNEDLRQRVYADTKAAVSHIEQLMFAGGMVGQSQLD